MFRKILEFKIRRILPILIGYFFSALFSFSQWSADTIFFDKDWKPSLYENAKYFRLMDIDTVKILFLVKDYYLSGQLQMEGAFRSINPDVQIGDFNYWYENGKIHISCNYVNGILNGLYREWYDNGNIKTEKTYNQGLINGLEQDWNENGNIIKSTEYKNGLRHGRFITYYQNGQPIRKENYINGELKNGKCFTYQGKDTTYFDYFIMPKFRGGIEGFKSYILEKLIYPDTARQNDEEGQVHIRFTIDKDGIIKGVGLVKEDKDYFNEEAIKVITSSPKWIPGKRDGKLVDVSITMPIIFRLK